MEVFDSLKRPLVSIIIPVYNGADYVQQAIDSALSQTYCNCEVIVVNDGSSDEGRTDQMCLSYGDAIRYIRKSNGGVASALNCGISLMNGDYFSWLSHDDVYLKDKILKQIEFIYENNLFNSIIYSNFYLVDKNTNILSSVKLPKINKYSFLSYIYNVHSIHGCTLMIPKRIFDETGVFDERHRTTQDYELWFKAAREHEFILFPDFVLLSRIHPEQGSKTITTHEEEIRYFYESHLLEMLEHYHFGHVCIAQTLYARIAAGPRSLFLQTMRMIVKSSPSLLLFVQGLCVFLYFIFLHTVSRLFDIEINNKIFDEI